MMSHERFSSPTRRKASTARMEVGHGFGVVSAAVPYPVNNPEAGGLRNRVEESRLRSWVGGEGPAGRKLDAGAPGVPSAIYVDGCAKQRPLAHAASVHHRLPPAVDDAEWQRQRVLRPLFPLMHFPLWVHRRARRAM